ncbi:MAG: DUF5703 domain-containing protein [Planctomycetota bacterium]
MKQKVSTKSLLAVVLLAAVSTLSIAPAAEMPASLLSSCPKTTCGAGVSPAHAAGTAAPQKRGVDAEQVLSVDYKGLVSRADLTYTKPVDRSEEGLPVGNGRMGSLVWTTPDAVKFQLNRVDVFAAGCNTRAFPRAGSDYAGGCGMVDIRLENSGDALFAAPSFRQHLSVYDGVMTARGNGVTARVMAWQQGDVMAVEIDDQREQPSAIHVDLRMLRYATQWMDARNWELTSQHAAVVRSGPHSATSRLDIRRGRILLTQEFREGTFYNASAVAIDLLGRTSKADYYNEMTVRLSAVPGKGKFTILMATAASDDPKEDVAAKALKELDAAQDKGLEGVLADNQAWWSRFWSKAFVRLHSDDGQADFVEQNYTYFLYIMASASRGAYMPHFNGMVWLTNGDMRAWGSQYWWHNQGCYYNGLAPANRPELLEPVFATYSRHYDSYARAARQQWGSQGIWIPETTWFDGLENLPDDIAAEMQDLYLMRKPWAQRSEKFTQFAQNKQTLNSRWNWGDHFGHWVQGGYVFTDKGKGPFGHVSHIFSCTAKIAYLYWLRYEYSLDVPWLRTIGYPIIKGTVEFYRNFPNVAKGSDGKYHISHVNNQESHWNSRDTVEEISAMRTLTPIAIRAAEILGVDAELRPVWKEFYENMAPLPNGPEPAAYYDLITLESEDLQSLKRLRDASLRQSVNADTRLHVLSREAVAAANLGLADQVKYMIPGQLKTTNEACDSWGVGESGLGVLRNRLGMREGPGCLECQRLGNAAHALHAALLQTAPPAPGKDSVIRVFAAWPRSWDAQFTLAARGAFLVSSSIQKGRIEFVEIQSQSGGECRLYNPWPGGTMSLYRNGAKAEDISGAFAKFTTHKGERIVLVPKGATPAKRDSAGK